MAGLIDGWLGRIDLGRMHKRLRLEEVGVMDTMVRRMYRWTGGWASNPGKDCIFAESGANNIVKLHICFSKVVS